MRFYENPYISPKEEEQIKKGAEIIRNGGVVAFPTETVYGLGANAFDENAVKKIFELKGRPQDNPLIIHIAKKEDVFLVAREVPKNAEILIEKFWPGPLTLVLPKNPSVPDIVTANLDTVAVRMPNHKIALKLIELSGVPISAPSANISGKPSATKPEHVKKYFGDKVFIIEGEVKIGIESTVIDLTVSPPIILRPGGISKEMIEKEVGGVDVLAHSDVKVAKSPGVKYKHYAPDSDVYLFMNRKDILRFLESERSNFSDKKVLVALFKYVGEEGEKIKLMGFDIVVSGRTLEDFAKNLFNLLIVAGEKYDVIIFEGVEERGIGLGIMNRLKKASKKVFY
ncbi:Threonylcarbamoyl-AMP synthase [bacterium HR19]|nr:Threonylcarbamoyl-AMP synthase [bacterium HR19]